MLNLLLIVGSLLKVVFDGFVLYTVHYMVLVANVFCLSEFLVGRMSYYWARRVLYFHFFTVLSSCMILRQNVSVFTLYVYIGLSTVQQIAAYCNAPSAKPSFTPASRGPSPSASREPERKSMRRSVSPVDHRGARGGSTGLLAASFPDTEESSLINVFLDVSNIQMGARAFADAGGARFCNAALYRTIVGARTVSRSIAFGSYNSGANIEKMVSYWKKVGYQDAVFSPRSFEGCEVNVDELIASAAKDVIIEKRGKLVLVTGDGNLNRGATLCSIHQTVLQALTQGVPVEIWSWGQSCSAKYEVLARDGHLTLVHIEDLFESGTLVAVPSKSVCVIS